MSTTNKMRSYAEQEFEFDDLAEMSNEKLDAIKTDKMARLADIKKDKMNKAQNILSLQGMIVEELK